MPQPWLANTDHAHAWEHQPWPAFAALAKSPASVAILPLYPFVSAEPKCRVDALELRASEILRLASTFLGQDSQHLILPPLRFLPATSSSRLFAVDFATAHKIGLSLIASIAESGFQKIILYCPHKPTIPFAATLAIDAREQFKPFTYVLSLPQEIATLRSGLDSSVPHKDELLSAATQLADLLVEIREHRAPKGPPATLAIPPDFESKTQASQPSFHSRALTAQSAESLASLAHAPNACALIPFAAIEQHGHHLPVGVDAILGQALLQQVLSDPSLSPSLWIAPPLYYGKSNEHKGWPGTVSLDAPSLYALTQICVDQLITLGFKRIKFLNTHGGNTAVLRCFLEAFVSPSVSIELLGTDFVPILPPQEAAWGMHADEWETSLMLACAPELVDMQKVVAEYPATLQDPGLLRPEKSAATYAWLTSDVSRSGVLGDPRSATKEKGHAWLSAEAKALAKSLAQ